MASREYCSNVSLELEEWSDKLHRLSETIDRLPTGDKFKIFSQVEGLHIILTELDDRLCGLMESCSIAGNAVEREVEGDAVYAQKFNLKGGEKFDYEFGG